MDRMFVYPLNLHVEAITTNMIIFGDRSLTDNQINELSIESFMIESASLQQEKHARIVLSALGGYSETMAFSSPVKRDKTPWC